MVNLETETLLAEGRLAFQTEGRLLQELGLRLVASPEVALVELIKNAYDADSISCLVRLEDNGRTLIIADDGNGMTFPDFESKWMRIATSSKIGEDGSPRFHRRLTGAKGIGRFAVRYLGDHLTLESVAEDHKLSCVTRLTAIFDWKKLDAATDISKTSVEYELHSVPVDTPRGTKLVVGMLRSTTDFTRSKELRDNVLRIVSPIQGLDRGQFTDTQKTGTDDEGFNVILPGEAEKSDLDPAKLVLDNYWARLTVALTRKRLIFQVFLPGEKKPKSLNVDVASSISKGCFADIRFFPRRKGVFQAKGISGRKAWRWVRENSGVAVVDHGFRIKPYGFPKDDWLHLDADKAHNERDWGSLIAKAKFPIPSAIRNSPADNPVLNVPYNQQLVGAVFIESQPTSDSDASPDLVPSMDREGLLQNEAFQQLHEFIRAGIEFLAHVDKAEMARRAQEEAKATARAAREDIQKAIEHIQNSPTLTPGDKGRIISQYRRFGEKLEEQEEYSAQARRSLMTMSLLGVVAGFMTHESKAMVHELEQAVEQVRALGKKNVELHEAGKTLSRRLDTFKGYLDYSRMFVQKIRDPRGQSLSAAGQARLVVSRFEQFAEERRIRVSVQIPTDVMTPPLPVTVYSGILLNLFTNGLKAVIAAQSSIKDPHVCFRAWSEKNKHILEVLDNGPGIPMEVRKRIWEPLYTTTSDIGNPLGSGMGLGLTLIKQVVAEFGGSISVVPEAPAGFTTCFRVILPNQ